MPIQLSKENGGKVLAVHVGGKLVKADYEHFVPEFERLVRQRGKLSVLFDMTGFHGWETSALWEDTKFAIKHFADIERIAMVGEKKNNPFLKFLSYFWGPIPWMIDRTGLRWSGRFRKTNHVNDTREQ